MNGNLIVILTCVGIGENESKTQDYGDKALGNDGLDFHGFGVGLDNEPNTNLTHPSPLTKGFIPHFTPPSEDQNFLSLQHSYFQ
ncbi:MAG: hypothetical protein Fur0032_03530 [Terrimicrobiaceae bacterium]